MKATEERNPEVLEYRVLWLGWYRRYRRGRWGRGSAIERGTKKPELAAEGGWLGRYRNEEGFLSAPGGVQGRIGTRPRWTKPGGGPAGEDARGALARHTESRLVGKRWAEEGYDARATAFVAHCLRAPRAVSLNREVVRYAGERFR